MAGNRDCESKGSYKTRDKLIINTRIKIVYASVRFVYKRLNSDARKKVKEAK